MSGENKTRVLCVDDHPLMRMGIIAVLRDEPDFEVVGEASTGGEAIRKFRELLPHVTIMDLRLPDMNGIDALIAIRRESPGARVVILTTFEGDAEIYRALKAGAQSYLLKSFPRQQILQTIRNVHAGSDASRIETAPQDRGHTGATSGREYNERKRRVVRDRERIPPEVAIRLAEYYDAETLSPREVQVLRSAACGCSNKIIADQLGITEHTVKAYMKTIFSKLNAKDRTHAVMIAMKRGFLSHRLMI